MVEESIQQLKHTPGVEEDPKLVEEERLVVEEAGLVVFDELDPDEAPSSGSEHQAETVRLEPYLAHSYKLLIYKLALK